MTDQETMIASMRLYRRRKTELEEQRERGRTHLEHVKAEVEADLASLEAEIERLKSSMAIFIREHNGGEKFRCPGLGTAYLTRRRKITIEDEQAFLEAFAEATGSTDELYDRRLNAARTRKAAEGYLQEYGELLPGVESEEVETLSVRLNTKEG